jgi:glutathione S-transferase
MMNFYMTPGSCSTGIHILLEELELVFSANVVNLPAGDNQKPAFLAINPKGTIPVLVLDSGVVLSDFVTIAWWLAMQYPRAKLLPDRLDSQAEVMTVTSDIVNIIHSQGFTRLFTTERYMQRADDREAVETQGREIIAKGFTQIAQRLETTGGYLFKQFSIADAALFYVEFWAQRIQLEMPKVCLEHLYLMQRRPVVQRVLAEEGYRIT